MQELHKLFDGASSMIVDYSTIESQSCSPSNDISKPVLQLSKEMYAV